MGEKMKFWSALADLAISIALLVMIVTFFIALLWPGSILREWIGQERTVAEAIFDGSLMLSIVLFYLMSDKKS